MNGGTTVTLAASVKEVQEHEDDPIKANANAIAPFSLGRADLAGGTVKILNGWDAKRAVYNVVRGTDLGRPDIQAVLGEEGFFCSPQAAALIEAGGLKQLAPAPNGVCGVSTQDPTTNFTVNESVATGTRLTATSPAANTVRLAARVVPSSEGTVSFYEGARLVRANVPAVSGQHSVTIARVPAGVHSYVARFTPSAGSLARASQSARVTVRVAGPAAKPAGPSAACVSAQRAQGKATRLVKAAQKKVTKAQKALKKAVKKKVSAMKRKQAKAKLKKAKAALKKAKNQQRRAIAQTRKACA